MNQNNSADIKFYIDNHFSIFPLKGKIPVKGLKWGTVIFNQFPDIEGNFGVKLSEEDLVIDIDPRNFAKGLSPLEAFQTAIDFRLKNSTFTVRTGGGGLHLYFKKPSQYAIKGALKEYPGVEFKTSGQYVVGAGGIHPDTKLPYVILYDKPIIYAPPKLLELLEKIENAPALGLTHFVDDTQTQDRFIHYLKTAPIATEGQNGDKVTFSVAAVGHDLGLHPDIAFDLMLKYYNNNCEPPWSPEELRKKLYNAYQYSAKPVGSASAIDKFGPVTPSTEVKDLRQDQYGRIQKQLYNVVTVFNIDMKDMLAFNLHSEDIIFLKPAPWHREGEIVEFWTDEESARCKYFMSKERLFEPGVQLIEEAIITIARQKPFHPIKDYIEGLEWDGFERLKNWLINYCGAEDNEYTRSVGLKTLVAAITRLYRPGYKFDYVPVLEGAQGIGKSRAVAILGGEWYGDITIDVHSKDTVDVMRRLWIIEVSELETVFRTETQALRSFLSRSSDICRLAYGRRSKTFPRQNIFIGTINPEESTDVGWLKDTTGNRRFWPVACTAVKVDELHKVRDQLWAEAYIYYKKHTALHFEDTRVEEQAMQEQTKRLGIDPWLDIISNWVDSGHMKDKFIITVNDIYTNCLGGKPTMGTRGYQNRIAIIMKQLHWDKGVYRIPGIDRPVRGYKRPQPVNELGL